MWRLLKLVWLYNETLHITEGLRRWGRDGMDGIWKAALPCCQRWTGLEPGAPWPGAECCCHDHCLPWENIYKYRITILDKNKNKKTFPKIKLCLRQSSSQIIPLYSFFVVLFSEGKFWLGRSHFLCYKPLCTKTFATHRTTELIHDQLMADYCYC